MRFALFILASGLAFATACRAGVAPSTMMGNVFRFSEAGAVLEICFASDAYKKLAPAKAENLRSLSGRLGRLVKAIGQYYDDDSIHPTYEATRARIAGESRLKLHMKNHYEYCGDRLATEMEKYVAENEQLLGGYFSKPRPGWKEKRAPEPGPPARK